MKSITFVIAAAMLALAPGARAQDKPCMADAARLCPGVEPGGGKQIECLKAHIDQVSAACKKNLVEAKEKQELNKEQPAPPQEQQPAPKPQP